MYYTCFILWIKYKQKQRHEWKNNRWQEVMSMQNLVMSETSIFIFLILWLAKVENIMML